MSRRLASMPDATPAADGYRCAQVIRILRLMRMIEHRTYRPPMAHLARCLDVSTRTIRRDLDVLRAIGVEVPEPETPENRTPDATFPAPRYALDLDEQPRWHPAHNRGGAR